MSNSTIPEDVQLAFKLGTKTFEQKKRLGYLNLLDFAYHIFEVAFRTTVVSKNNIITYDVDLFLRKANYKGSPEHQEFPKITETIKTNYEKFKEEEYRVHSCNNYIKWITLLERLKKVRFLMGWSCESWSSIIQKPAHTTTTFPNYKIVPVCPYESWRVDQNPSNSHGESTQAVEDAIGEEDLSSPYSKELERDSRESASPSREDVVSVEIGGETTTNNAIPAQHAPAYMDNADSMEEASTPTQPAPASIDEGQASSTKEAALVEDASSGEEGSAGEEGEPDVLAHQGPLGRIRTPTQIYSPTHSGHSRKRPPTPLPKGNRRKKKPQARWQNNILPNGMDFQTWVSTNHLDYMQVSDVTCDSGNVGIAVYEAKHRSSHDHKEYVVILTDLTSEPNTTTSSPAPFERIKFGDSIELFFCTNVGVPELHMLRTYYWNTNYTEKFDNESKPILPYDVPSASTKVEKQFFKQSQEIASGNEDDAVAKYLLEGKLTALDFKEQVDSSDAFEETPKVSVRETVKAFARMALKATGCKGSFVTGQYGCIQNTDNAAPQHQMAHLDSGEVYFPDHPNALILHLPLSDEGLFIRLEEIHEQVHAKLASIMAHNRYDMPLQPDEKVVKRIFHVYCPIGSAILLNDKTWHGGWYGTPRECRFHAAFSKGDFEKGDTLVFLQQAVRGFRKIGEDQCNTVPQPILPAVELTKGLSYIKELETIKEARMRLSQHARIAVMTMWKKDFEFGKSILDKLGLQSKAKLLFPTKLFDKDQKNVDLEYIHVGFTKTDCRLEGIVTQIKKDLLGVLNTLHNSCNAKKTGQCYKGRMKEIKGIPYFHYSLYKFFSSDFPNLGSIMKTLGDQEFGVKMGESDNLLKLNGGRDLVEFLYGKHSRVSLGALYAREVQDSEDCFKIFEGHLDKLFVTEVKFVTLAGHVFFLIAVPISCDVGQCHESRVCFDEWRNTLNRRKKGLLDKFLSMFEEMAVETKCESRSNLVRAPFKTLIYSCKAGSILQFPAGFLFHGTITVVGGEPRESVTFFPLDTKSL